MDSCIKWSTDYFLAAHQSESELVGQVGDGEADHAWWGRPEEMTMARYISWPQHAALPPPQALLDSGYYFSSASHLDPRDLWWFLVFTSGILEDHKLTVHVCTADCTAAKILLECRDLCRTEAWAFEDYKTAKVEAAKGSWGEYKKGKGSNSKLLAMLREKHGHGK